MYSYTYIHTHICIILDGKLLKTFHRVKHLKSKDTYYHYYYAKCT